MKNTLKVLSAVLTYPSADLLSAIPDLKVALRTENALSATDIEYIEILLNELESGDLLDLQERYVLLFDRTRSLSLHLFEHVHGESRDRGQAMVDLQQLYEKEGLYVGANELPDFMPVFLEFLSTQPEQEARELLNEPLHIFEALRQRLRKRKSSYASVFTALTYLAGKKANTAAVKALLDHPDPDPDDLKALDAAWEEEEVRFGPQAAECGKENLISRLRAGTRPAEGMPIPARKTAAFKFSSTTVE